MYHGDTGLLSVAASFSHRLCDVCLRTVSGIGAEKYVFADAELKSQVIVGLILIAAAEFVSLSDQDFAEEMLVPALLALGVGIIGSRFLLFYIKLAKHCQRGTSMSSFFLGVGTGVELRNRIGFLAGEGLVSEGSWYGSGDLESCV